MVHIVVCKGVVVVARHHRVGGSIRCITGGGGEGMA